MSNSKTLKKMWTDPAFRSRMLSGKKASAEYREKLVSNGKKCWSDPESREKFLAARRKRVKPLEQRFWEKVQKESGDGCWLWKGKITKYGYGSMKIGTNGEIKAHRLSWTIHKGSLPTGDVCVCHRCDVRSCVRPDHLFIGSRSDNVADMVAKGRQSKTGAGGSTVKGEDHGRSKLTWEDVRDIRRRRTNGEKRRHIRAAYPFVSDSQMSRIFNGTNWKE